MIYYNIWASDAAQPTYLEEIERSVKSWKRFHPNLPYKIITKTACPENLYTRFGPKLYMYDELESTWGLFLDPDTTVLHPLDDLLRMIYYNPLVFTIGWNCSVQDSLDNVFSAASVPACSPWHNMSCFGFQKEAWKPLELAARQILLENPEIYEEQCVNYCLNDLTGRFPHRSLAPTIQPRTEQFYRASGPGRSLIWHSRKPLPKEE